MWKRTATVFPLLVLLVLASCTKQNNIDNSSTLAVGQQCVGTNDVGCGVGAVCALGYCRSGCTTDAECGKGSLCVGDRPPFGCTLPAELACSSSQPCAAPLTCGIDGKCRNKCKVSADCIRNEQTCISGACVSASDPDTRWAQCKEGETACGLTVVPGVACGPEDIAKPQVTSRPHCDEVYACHRGTPGWTLLGTCAADKTWQCGGGITSGHAACSPFQTPINKCVDVLSFTYPSEPCVLVVPSQPNASLTLFVDGTEVKDGITLDTPAQRAHLSEELCARVRKTSDVRFRVCPPT